MTLRRSQPRLWDNWDSVNTHPRTDWAYAPEKQCVSWGGGSNGDHDPWPPGARTCTQPGVLTPVQVKRAVAAHMRSVPVLLHTHGWPRVSVNEPPYVILNHPKLDIAFQRMLQNVLLSCKCAHAFMEQ